MVKVKVEDDGGEVHVLTMFSNTLDKIVNTVSNPPSIVKRALINLPKMDFIVNSNNVVVEAGETGLGTWRVKVLTLSSYLCNGRSGCTKLL